MSRRKRKSATSEAIVAKRAEAAEAAQTADTATTAESATAADATKITEGVSAKVPERRSRLRTVAVAAGILVVLIGAWPATRQAVYSYDLSQAREAIDQFQFLAAQRALEHAISWQPRRPEAHYLLATVQRRTGRLDKVEAGLVKAGQLGWPKIDLERQRLLMRAQLGRFNEVESQLKALMQQQGIDDQTAVQVYEALANGYWINHRIEDSMQALNFWIQWRPRDIDPRILRADLYSEFNDPVSAEKEYREILSFAPDHLLSREMLGRLLLSRGHVDEATEQFRYCLTRGHQRPAVITGLAECEFRSSRAEQAEQELARLDLAKLDPEARAKALKLRADVQRFQGKHAEAAKSLEEAVADWPHDGGIQQALAQVYVTLGKRELAEKHLQLSKEISARAERFLELKRRVVREPNNAELRFEIGQILLAQDLLDDAANWWRSAVRCDWTHQPSQEALAEYYRIKGKPELESRFRETARRAVGVTFDRAWGALSRGEVPLAEALDGLLEKYPEVALQHQLIQAGLLIKKKEFDAAKRLLEKPLATPALRPLALTLEAEILIANGQTLAAEPLLVESLKQFARNVNAHRWLGVIYYDLGAMDRAETHLIEVSQLDPNDYRALRLLGVLAKDYENYAPAIGHYQLALTRNPPKEIREEILLDLADCMIRQRENETALKVLNDATPSLERSVKQAECHYNAGRREEAIKLLDDVLAQSAQHFQALLLRGDIAMVAGDLKRAVDLLDRAVQVQPYDHIARLKFSQALSRSGQTERFKKELERADELKGLRERFAKLHEQAIAKPYDIDTRRQLASTAKSLGRVDLEEVWLQAVQALEKRPADAPESPEP